MKKTGNIATVILMFAFAFTSAIAKPVRHDMALSDLKKPFSTLTRTSRPPRDHHIATPGGHFIIHYNNSGLHAVPQDYTLNDSIPDFVFKAAEYLDESYSMLHDSLGYDHPPIDNIESPEIDVYFNYDLSYYGVTYPETDLGNGEYTSYLTLSTQLEDSTIFYTHGLEGLRVTCAHELFHIFQLGYKYRSSDLYYFEFSSVWFEEYMYPEINDYHSYFSDYVDGWDVVLTSNSGMNPYQSAGFNFYIDKHFSSPGNNIIQHIWDRILTVNAITAIRNELESRGSSLEEALNGWGCSQVLCGPFSAPNFQYSFDDAAELESINFSRNTDHLLTSATDDIALTKTPITSYYKISGIPSNILLFEAMFDNDVSASLIGLNDDQSKVYPIGSQSIIIDGADYDDYILVIGSDASNASGSYAFTALYEDQMAALYPNPLSSGEKITLSYVLLEDNQKANLSIYNLSGRSVYSRSLSSTYKVAGLHDLSFTPPALSSGLYIVALQFDDTVIAEKFTYLK